MEKRAVAAMFLYAAVVQLMMKLLMVSEAYQFVVGGKDGWVLNPSECYNHWAERNRFQVNDTLFFRYGKGKDSVLVVTKDDYYKCNTNKPLKSLTDGKSIFKFDRSGPFFFISGIADKCNAGERLIVVVLAVRHHTPSGAPPKISPTSPPPPAVPVSPPPKPEPPVPVPVPTVSPPPSEVPAPAPGHSSASQMRLSWLGSGVVSVMVTTGVGLVMGNF